MRRIYASVLPFTAITLIACKGKAQNETTRQVAGGGISVSGWQGKIDPGEARRGQVLSNAKVSQEGKALHGTTGPAGAFWESADNARRGLTGQATFTQAPDIELQLYSSSRVDFLCRERVAN